MKLFKTSRIHCWSNGQWYCKLKKLKSDSFELILVDYNLPNIIGEEILSKIKANGGSYGKAVLMSGDDTLKGQFESKVFNFFLHKPVTKPKFKEFVDKL